MQTHFEQELSQLSEKLLTMASYAESAVSRATEALTKRDAALADKVRREDDLIDGLEKDVDEMSIRLLAKAPLATDLRLIMVAMKISQNLERIGDEATKIAKRTLDLLQSPPLPQNARIPEFTRLALGLLKRSLDSFVARDSKAARELIPLDKEVDQLNRLLQSDLVTTMTAKPEVIPQALHLMVIFKSLERIADHAKNIAEETVFLCEAEDVRHQGARKSVG